MIHCQLCGLPAGELSVIDDGRLACPPCNREHVAAWYDRKGFPNTARMLRQAHRTDGRSNPQTGAK